MERLRLAMPLCRRALLSFAPAFVALLFTPACTRPPAQQAQDVHRTQQPPAPGQIVAPPFVPTDDGQWTMPAKDYASTRFSSLEEINTGNAANLKVAWTFSTGNTRGHEAAPLVVGGTMYIVTPYPNVLYALDLTKPGAPAKWKYEPKPSASSQGVACCDLVNRGAAYSNGKIFYNTLDDQTVAVDANTGQEVWRTQLGDINRGETITMAPLVVKDKVLVGNSGGEFGVRGWLTALDAATGKIAWRAYHTGPDKDCLIGANFKPF
ncbi:MAG: lanthanide-dependent methanol dehydrogenase, partial [Acidobacteriota bacterium]|nr:lanthanide-dependent methanol dehydrogenase [Acidobacteriota bacterium]